MVFLQVLIYVIIKVLTAYIVHNMHSYYAYCVPIACLYFVHILHIS